MKPKIWTFLIPSDCSTGTSKYIKFVRKSEYDKLAKEFSLLKKEQELTNETMQRLQEFSRWLFLNGIL